MPEPVNIWAVIPAAGIGSRMEAEIPKQYLKIQHKCILEHTLERFCHYSRFSGVVVAVAEDDPYWPTLSVSSHEKLMQCTGGEQRCHSVLNGLRCLEAVAAKDDWVLVHDAARPCVRIEDIDILIDSVVSAGAVGGLLAVPVRDTMKRGDNANIVTTTVDRTGLWHALTPQMFRLSELMEAIDAALQQELFVTDEAQAMEQRKMLPLLVEGHPDNIKITHPRDLSLAELFLALQEKIP